MDKQLYASELKGGRHSDYSGSNAFSNGSYCYPIKENFQEISVEEALIPSVSIDRCCSSRAPPNLVANCLQSNELVPQQSPDLVSDKESYPANHHCSSDATIGKMAALGENLCCSILDGCTTGPFHPRDIGENGAFKSDSVVVRRNPKRAASMKSMLSTGKIDQGATKSHARSSKKKVGVSNVIWDSLKTATKKRSYRPSNHVSDWGAIENLFKVFKQDNRVLAKNNRVILSKTSSRASISSRGRRRESKAKRSSENAIEEAISEDNLLQINDLHSFQVSNLIHFPPSIMSVPENCLSVDGNDCVSSHFLLEDSIVFPESGVQLLDKDPDSSVTEEISGETNLGDLPGVSSQEVPPSLQDSSEDGLPIYADTSPESDVIHPVGDDGTIANDVILPKDPEMSDPGFISESAVATESHIPNISDSCCFPFKCIPVSSVTSHNSLVNRKNTSDVRHYYNMFQSSDTCSLGNTSSSDDNGKNAKCKNELKIDGSNFTKCYNRKSNKKLSKSSVDPEFLAVKSDEPVNLLHCSDTVRGKVCVVNFLSPCAGDKIIKDAEVGESRCEAPSNTCIDNRDTIEHLNKKEKAFIDRRKSKSKLQLDKQDTAKETCALDAFIEKNEISLTSSLLNKAAESLSHSWMKNVHVTNKELDSAKSRVDGDNLVGRFSTGSALESDIAYSKDANEIQNLVGQGPETLCSREDVAWVCCDDCSKWRSIPEKLADMIDETNCRWTCKDNVDKRFADCAIPQAKSNSEINAELGILDEEVIYDLHQSSNVSANKRASWISIRSNLYLHRSLKKQSIDEIMVCHCKPPFNRGMGCKDECLNRMLNIECVRGSCPCGDLCSNQQFQKRKYARMKWFQSGKKGYGLKLLENVSEGDFLIEYVGEVLDMATYEARQKEYASRGQEHFYFMTLNSHEVIDACSKGNQGRFINHSCEPNCRTEKWMVKGEVCIGLFAMRDINKGEEITFDYNYVRVVGAAAKKCYCGSANCRGFIGGDPLDSERIVQCDLDDEYSENVVDDKDDTKELYFEQRISHVTETTDVTDEESREPGSENELLETTLAVSQQHSNVSVFVKDTIDEFSSVGLKSKHILPIEIAYRDSVDGQLADVSSEMKPVNKYPAEMGLNRKSEPPINAFMETSLDNRLKSSADTHTETSINNRTNVSADTCDNRMVTSKSHLPKLSPFVGNSKSSSASRFMVQKLKKTNVGSSSSQFEAEDKLNTILDSDGGISKRKDSAKGYLKLLVVTALSNNADHVSTQSTRDLSLILDALLKTKSRTVLTDIINKNGLQMLHHILKQNCESNNKIPVLRKLLKVLEYLASKGIISVEQINMDPVRTGAESFRDSILKLTFHNDIQVHQIARNFRDRWIPRMFRTTQVYRDQSWSDLHNESFLPCKRYLGPSVKDEDNAGFANKKDRALSPAVSIQDKVVACFTNQEPSNSNEEDVCTNVTKIRKRKSRWDQDKPLDKKKPASAVPEAQEDATRNIDNNIGQNAGANFSESAAASSSFQPVVDDEVPPGFASPEFVPHCNPGEHESVIEMPSTSGFVVVGQVQDRYLANMAVSHGIPLVLMQQLGSPGSATGSIHHCWTVAPAMPFHPFPPLPLYPRDNIKDYLPSTSSSMKIDHCLAASGSADRCRMSGELVYSSLCDQSVPSVSGQTTLAAPVIESFNSRYIDRCRMPIERACFRPEKYDRGGPRRFGSRWMRGRHHQLKFNMKYGTHGRIIENARERRGKVCDPNGVRGEDVGSTFHQQQQKES